VELQGAVERRDDGIAGCPVPALVATFASDFASTTVFRRVAQSRLLRDLTISLS
jgi:hypothetical protein